MLFSIEFPVRKAKLHMARALIMNPEVLILEKPMMNLDEARNTRIFEKKRAIRSECKGDMECLH